MAANNDNVMRADAEPVDFIKLSGTRTDSEDFFVSGDRLSSYTVSNLKSRSGDQAPGDSIPEVRFRVGNAQLRDSAKHCNFAGDECWYVRTHPKIDTVSATSGYTTGGQEIKITGWGLKGTTLADVEVTIDGVSCAVTSTDKETITCVTGAASAPSLDGVSQPGSPGLTQSKMDSDNPTWEMRTDGSVAPY